MTELLEYSDRYSRAALRREGGVLEVRLHNGSGGSLVWDEPAHRELPELFADVAHDAANKVIIIAGTGADFCSAQDSSGWPKLVPSTWDKLFTEGRHLLRNLLDIEVPVIGVVNGPARWHAEILLLSDVVLASETAVFQDVPHFPYAVPGDGVHTVWPLLLGPNRGRYFLLTNEEIGAEEARQLGVVGEVLPADRALPRAWDLARQLDRHDALTLKYTRLALTHRLKRAILEDLPYGLALEGLAGIGISQ